MTRRKSNHGPHDACGEYGFSLIELAIVLVVALLLGGLLVPLSMQVEQQKIKETQKAMEESKEALIGYALAHSSTPNNRQGVTFKNFYLRSE